MMIIGLHLQASAWIWTDDNCIYDYVCLQSAFDRPFNLTEGFAVQTPKKKKKVNLQRRICYSLCLWHRFIAIKMVTKIGLLTMCCLIMPVIFGIKYAQALHTTESAHGSYLSCWFLILEKRRHSCSMNPYDNQTEKNTAPFHGHGALNKSAWKQSLLCKASLITCSWVCLYHKENHECLIMQIMISQIDSKYSVITQH